MFEKRVSPVGFYPLVASGSPIPASTLFGRLLQGHGKNVLYLHIPFCAQRCSFCFFYLYKAIPTLLTEYLSVLKDELRQIRQCAEGRPTIEAVFIGGGSPSVLSGDQIAELMAAVNENFSLPCGAEVTMEWYPGDGAEQDFRAAVRNGVTRMSFGAQALTAQRARQLRLHHGAEQVRLSVERAFAAGVQSVNVDLISCLPTESEEELASEIEAAMNMRCTFISVNPLEIIPRSPLSTRYKARSDYISDAEVARRVDFTNQLFRDHGWHQQRFFNYHKPGFGHRYNEVSALPLANIIGCGAGAYGWVDGIAYVNPTDLSGYTAEVRGARGVRGNSCRARADEVQRSYVITALLELAVDADAYRKAFGGKLEEDFADELKMLLTAGALVHNGQRYELTSCGRVWGDNVCSLFYSEQQRRALGKRFDAEAVHHYSPAELKYFGRRKQGEIANPAL